MQISIFSNLVDNAALLLAVMAVYGFLLAQNFRWDIKIKKVAAGFLLGLIGLAVMINPLELLPGIIFDTRSILISITGLFFGSIPTVIVVLTTAIYRIHLGGSGVITGVGVILISATVGLSWRHLRKNKSPHHKAPELYIFGLVVHILMLLMMLSLPSANRLDVLNKISLPILIIYPAVTVFIGLLLSSQLQSVQLNSELEERELRLRLSNELANVAVWEYSFITNSMSRSENHDSLYGLEWQEKWDINTFTNATHPEDRAYSNKIIEESVAPGGPNKYEFDFRVIHPDQTIHWLMVKGEVIKRDDKGWGKIVRGALIDITERKKAEQALKESEERLGLVMEGSQLGYWDWDMQAGIVERNQRWAEMLGYSLEEIELNVKQWTDLHHPDDKEIAWQSIQDHLDGKTPVHRAEYRMLAKDGSYRWILDQAKIVKRDSEGKPLRMSGTHTDITHLKEAEAALRASEQRFQEAFHASPIGINLVRLSDNRSIDVNEACAKIYGYAQDEIIGRTADELKVFIDPQARQKWREELVNGRRIQNQATQVRQKSGAIRDVLISIEQTTIENEAVVLIVMSDITVQVKSEQALRQAEERFSQAFHASPVGMNMFRLGDNISIDINKAFLDIIGYQYGEVVGRSAAELKLFPDPEVRAVWMQTLQTEGHVKNQQTKIRRKSGEHVDVLASMEITEINGEKVVMVVASDITERVQAQELLIESERRYRLLFENMNAGFVLFEVVQDQSGKPVDLIIKAANQGFEATTGLTQDAVGQRLTSVLPGIEHDEANWIGTYGEIAITGEPKLFEQGSELLGYVYSVFAYRADHNQCAVTFIDVTDRKKAERKLRESEEKFAAMFRASPVPISIYKMNGEIIEANPAYLALTGYNYKETVGSSSIKQNLLNEEMRKKVITQMENNAGTLRNFEVDIQVKDGSTRTILLSGEDITIGGEPYRLGINVDITDRKRTQSEISRLNDRIKLATQSAQMGIWDWDIKQNILIWDEHMYALYGIEEKDFLGAYEAWTNGLHPDDRVAAEQETAKALNGEKEYDTEFRVIWPNGSIRHLKANAIIFRDQEGNATRMVGVNYDITQQKLAGEEIRQSEERFSKAFHSSPAALSITRIADGKFVDVNDTFLKLFEYQREEVIQHTSTDLKMWTPEERQKIVKQQIATGGLRNTELTALSKSGNPIHLLFSSQQLDINHEPCLITTMIDISERKAIAEEREKLTARLAEVQEEERRKLAKELHDRVGQNLSALSINIKLIKSRIGKESAEKIAERFKTTQDLLAEISDKTRDVMAELHPPVLDDYGLAAALRWYAEKIEEQTGLAINVEGEMILPRISQGCAIGLYRISQEAVTNILKHANASQVEILLSGDPETIRLMITDDGQGFDVNEVLQTPTFNWGINLMYERAHILGGTIQVTSTPKSGTSVEVQIPR